MSSNTVQFFARIEHANWENQRMRSDGSIEKRPFFLTHFFCRDTPKAYDLTKARKVVLVNIEEFLLEPHSEKEIEKVKQAIANFNRCPGSSPITPKDLKELVITIIRHYVYENRGKSDDVLEAVKKSTALFHRVVIEDIGPYDEALQQLLEGPDSFALDKLASHFERIVVDNYCPFETTRLTSFVEDLIGASIPNIEDSVLKEHFHTLMAHVADEVVERVAKKHPDKEVRKSLLENIINASMKKHHTHFVFKKPWNDFKDPQKKVETVILDAHRALKRYKLLAYKADNQQLENPMELLRKEVSRRTSRKTYSSTRDYEAAKVAANFFIHLYNKGLAKLTEQYTKTSYSFVPLEPLKDDVQRIRKRTG